MPSGHVPATSPLRPAFLAAGCIGVIAAMPAQAQDAAQTVLGGVTVTDTAIAQAPVKVERAESPKYVRPLLDTPHDLAERGLGHAKPGSRLGKAALLGNDDKGGQIGDFIPSHLSPD